MLNTMGRYGGLGFAAIATGSERDVVVFERVRGFLSRTRGRGRRSAWSTAGTFAAIAAVSPALASATAAATAGTAKHLHLVGDDVGRVAFDAVLVGVFVGAQRTFDVDLPALLEIFAGDFAELAEQHDAVPFGAFLVL